MRASHMLECCPMVVKRRLPESPWKDLGTLNVFQVQSYMTSILPCIQKGWRRDLHIHLLKFLEEFIIMFAYGGRKLGKWYRSEECIHPYGMWTLWIWYLRRLGRSYLCKCGNGANLSIKLNGPEEAWYVQKYTCMSLPDTGSLAEESKLYK